MELKAKALVLSSEDMGENDKLAVILTDTAGKIRVKLRGVKKKDAKLKFAAQPFCFMDAVIHQKGAFYTVMNASPIDLFYGIVTDLEKIYAGYVILECTDALTGYNSNGELLPETLKALQAVGYDETADLKTIVAHFLSQALVGAGYRLELKRCAVCGVEIHSQEGIAVDLLGGGVKCPRCMSSGDKSMKKETYEALLKLRTTDYTRLSDLHLGADVLSHALTVYNKLIEVHCFKKLNSMAQFMSI